LISNQGYQPDTALQTVQEGYADIIAFGKHFISNPDLVDKIKNNWELTKGDFSTFFGGTEKGYTDYPIHEGAEKPKKKSGFRLFGCFKAK